jgi:tetratricopeptide (TPR) repeat protein
MKALYLFVAILFCSCKVLHQTQKSVDISDSFKADYDFSLVEAQKQMMLGNYLKAKSLYLHCLEIKPKSAAVFFQLANLYITGGHYDIALDYARQAFQIDRQNEWYALQLGQIYQIKNNIDSAIFCYQSLVKKSPKFDHMITLAVLYIRAKRLNPALKLLNLIESQYGLSNQTITNKYRIYILKNDNKNSIRVLRDAIEKFPEQTQYYGLLGEHFSTIGEYGYALEVFTKLLLVDSGNESGYLSIIELYKKFEKTSLEIDSAESFVNRKDFSIENKIKVLSGLLYGKIDSVYSWRVCKMIDSLIVKYPDNLKIPVLKADFYLNQKNYESAEEQLKDILIVDKRNKNAFEKLMYVLNIKYNFYYQYFSTSYA